MRNMMLSVILALTLVPAMAQEKEQVTKIIEVRNLDVRELPPLLLPFGAAIQFSLPLRRLVVSGRPETVAAVEEAVRRMDVPAPAPKNVEITAYILMASPQPGGNVPPELEGVTKQLKNLFSYQGFRLLDTMVLRVRDGESGEASAVGTPPADFPTNLYAKTVYQARFTGVGVSGDDKIRLLRIRELKFGARIPYSTGGSGYQFNEVGFNTGIDVREGQKVVVGKANVDGSNNAMTLVVTARVVE